MVESTAGRSPDLRGEVRALILVRLLVMTVLGLLTWGAARESALEISPGPAIALLVGIWALTILYWAGLRFGISLTSLVAAQLILDLFLETLIVAGTGAAKSPFTILYLLTIFTAGALGGRRASVLTALGAALCYAAVAALPAAAAETGRAAALLRVVVSGATFLLMGVFSGLLSERLHRQRQGFENATEELARVRTSTDRIMEKMPIGLLTATAQGKILRINQAAREILGIRPHADLADTDLAEFLEPLAPELVDALESILITGKWSLREEIVLYEKGEARPIGVAITPLVSSEGALDGVIVTFNDLSELRQMEAKLLRSEQLATLGELAAGVAHEIRNPLASISGAVQVLKGEVREDGDEAELMELIVRESERLNRIITGFLDYTRDHSPSRDAHDVSVIAREVVRLIQHDKQLTMGKTILVEFPKNQQFTAEVEQEGLRQVFINLARNALEAMQLGGILRITGENPGRGRIYVVFRDTGVGIAPHELEHVFKPFHTSKEGGTGLGLAIANRIVESSGGAVRIKSTPGMGTAVTVELKAARESSPSSHTEELPTSSEGTRSVEATS